MAGLNGQLVRLPNSSSVAIETLSTGSIVSGVALPGLSLNENGWRSWSSTDISSTHLDDAIVNHVNHRVNDVVEFNGGNLSVEPFQKVLIKDNSGSYQFVQANQVEVNSDSLVKYVSGSIVEELITSAYTVQNQNVTSIGIEDIDVYLLDGYIVHNPPIYDLYSCESQSYIGTFEMAANDPGANSGDCYGVENVEEVGSDCVYTCGTGDSGPFAALTDPCGRAGSCGDADTSPGPQGAKGQKGAGGAQGGTGAQGGAGGEGPAGAQGPTGPAGI